MEDLEALFLQASKGDQKALEAIVKATEKSVYTYALSLLRNREDAMDVAQNAYVKLWQTLPSFRGVCTPMTWLYRILKSSALDYIRHKQVTQSKTDPLETEEGLAFDPKDEDVSADPVEAYEQKEKILAVRKALRELPERDRELIILRDINGLAYEKIAEIESLPLGTVKSRLCRARRLLKRILESRNFSI